MSLKQAQFYYLEKGQAVGPVASSVLVELIRQGRMFALDAIYQEEDSKWRKVSEFPEFADVLRAQQVPQQNESQWVLLTRKAPDRGKGFIQGGPFTTSMLQERLASGSVKYTDYVWKKGMKEWGKIAELEEFMPKTKNADLPPPNLLFEAPPFPHESSNDLLKNVLIKSALEQAEQLQQTEPSPPPEAGTPDLAQERLAEIKAAEAASASAAVSEAVTVTSIRADAEEPERNTKPDIKTDTTKVDTKTDIKAPTKKSQSAAQKTSRKSSSRTFLKVAAVSFLVFFVGLYLVTFHRSQIVGLFASTKQHEPAPQVVQQPRPVDPVRTATPPAQVTERAAAPRPEPVVKVDLHGPTSIRAQLYDLRTDAAKVIIETDATTPETHVEFLFTAESGEVLDRRSVHRSFRRNLENGRGEFMLKSFHLPDGSYFMRVQAEGGVVFERAFFLGLQDVKFRERLRHHKKQLSFWFQMERQRLFHLAGQFHSDVQDIESKAASLGQAPGAWQGYSASMKTRLERMKNRELKTDSALDNLCLWPQWLQLRELVQSTQARLNQYDSAIGSGGGGRVSSRDLVDQAGRLRARIQRESLWRQ